MNLEEKNQIAFILMLGEIRTNINGEEATVNFETLEINDVVLPVKEFWKVVGKNAKSIIAELKKVKWVTSTEYCKAHEITREGLAYRKRKKIVRTKENGSYLLYDIDTPKKH